MNYTLLYRPGYFGRRRDEKIKALNDAHGEGNWTIVWDGDRGLLEFEDACKLYYEPSYLRHFVNNPEDLDFVCSFQECYDNAITNILSGVDYTKQEAFSTHIQDIAVRNVLVSLGRKFSDKNDGDGLTNFLQIRGEESNGFKFNPGQISFYDRDQIHPESKAPSWAKPGSVEDFWQSNKWIALIDE